MPDIHFFTNSAALQPQPQTAQQKYGPVEGQEDSQYRVTSRFAASGTPMAYAVCEGKVFAQEVSGRINLVLKPVQQPVGIHAPVRYYIYKGILQDSLLQDSLVDAGDATLIAAAAKSDLTAAIHESQGLRNAARNLTGAAAPKPTRSAVGLNRTAAAAAPDTLADLALLDEVFLRLDADEYPMVKGGASLGQFHPAAFGFEIVLDALGEGPRVAAVRQAETIIVALSSAATDADRFRGADRRERILDYIDPCAFYAAFFIDGVQVKAHSTDAKFVPKKRDSLHTSVLSKFATSNMVYLDLRNEHNHGLNYYREYGASANAHAQFRIAYDGGGSTVADYEFHGWPIFAIPVSTFTGSDPKKPGTISLRLPAGANSAPLIHRGQGYFFTGFRRNHHAPDTKETLRKSIAFEADGLTAPIAFSIPKLADNTVIAGYVNVRYLKRIVAPPVVNPPAASIALKAAHFFDNLFELTHLLDGNDLRIPIATNDVTAWHVTGGKAIVDETSQYGPPYMARIGVGRDPSNVYFFACTEQAPLATASSKTPALLPLLATRHATNIEFGFVPVMNRPVLSYGCLPAGVIEPPSDRSFNIDATSMIALALDKDELPAIVTAAASFDTDLDKRLALLNASDFQDSSGSVAGTEYSLFVIGYKLGTAVTVAAADTKLKVWHLHSTPRVFSTKDAALNSDGLSGVKQNLRHFTRSRTALDVDWGLREGPKLTATKVGTSNGRVLEFEVLGKVHSDQDWYLVQTTTTLAFPAFPSPRIFPGGSRFWIGYGDGFYPVASFEKFICDLTRLNAELDEAQKPGTLDTLQQRITRLRQMTKEFVENPTDTVLPHISVSKLFDEIIGATASAPPPVTRLNDLHYVAGVEEQATDGGGTTHTIATEMQLFRDYMGVEFGKPGKGIIVDLHHLFVGLDVLFHSVPSKTIDPRQMFVNPTLAGLDSLPNTYGVGHNVDSSTWAGDIGAAPADWDVGSDDDYKDRLDKDKTRSEEQREELLLVHYYSTRAGDADLYPDVFAHFVHQQMRERLHRNSAFRNIGAALYHFNRQLTIEGYKTTFRPFFKHANLDEKKLFRDQQTSVEGLKAAVRLFARLWWIRRNPFKAAVLYGALQVATPGSPAAIAALIALGAATEPMWPVADRYTGKFVEWLEAHK